MSDPTADPNGDPLRDRGHTRIGPMIFVPELTTRGPDDPWAHRKGEPRYFALLWTLYLLVSALLTVFSIRSVGMPTQEQFLLGGRGMTLLCALGVCPLWPMVRLSQVSAARPIRAAWHDALILTVPSWSVILPISLLTGWTVRVSLALCLLLAVWAVVSGGLVAFGSSRESRTWRFGCAALAWALALGAPLAVWAGTALNVWAVDSPIIEKALLLSPVSAIFVLTSPAPGAVYGFLIRPGDWWWILLPALPGLVLWALAWKDSRGSTRRVV